MKSLLIISFLLLVGLNGFGQTKLKPLTDEEIMFPDSINGTLKIWTKKEKKNFLTDCESKTKEILSNNKEYCKCTMENLMKGVNYNRYEKLSEYQKGKLTSLHGEVNCQSDKLK